MKRKNWPLRIVCAFLFLFLSGLIMLSIYTLSSEDGAISANRSQIVTEALKQEVNEKIESTPEGFYLAERIKAKVIQYSPYGSDWHLNVRKVGHFTIYFALATMAFITLAILGVKKFMRIVLIVGFCAVFAYFDEMHQGEVVGRAMTHLDMFIDLLGACTSVAIMTAISMLYSVIAWIGKAIFDH